MLVVGDKEMEGGPLTVRRRGSQEQQMMEKNAFLEEILAEVATKKL